MRGMRRHLFKNDLEHWAGSFFDALRGQSGQAVAADPSRGQPGAQG
jgi:trehalose 6-phosphate synthase